MRLEIVLYLHIDIQRLTSEEDSTTSMDKEVKTNSNFYSDAQR